MKWYNQNDSESMIVTEYNLQFYEGLGMWAGGKLDYEDSSFLIRSHVSCWKSGSC